MPPAKKAPASKAAAGREKCPTCGRVRPVKRPAGPVEVQVRAAVKALGATGALAESLAAMSYVLAARLDDDPANAATTVNRELRNNLLELKAIAEEDDDDLDAELSTPVVVPAQVGDTAQP